MKVKFMKALIDVTVGDYDGNDVTFKKGTVMKVHTETNHEWPEVELPDGSWADICINDDGTDGDGDGVQICIEVDEPTEKTYLEKLKFIDVRKYDVPDDPYDIIYEVKFEATSMIYDDIQEQLWELDEYKTYYLVFNPYLSLDETMIVYGHSYIDTIGTEREGMYSPLDIENNRGICRKGLLERLLYSQTTDYNDEDEFLDNLQAEFCYTGIDENDTYEEWLFNKLICE